MISIQQHWYRKTLSWLTFLLLPLSWLFYLIQCTRKFFYLCGVFASYRASLPVIVVGNISVGGTGKTPLVINLAEALLARGVKPAIIMRGYGARTATVRQVTAESLPADVGDEAILLFNHLSCPVIVGKNRAEAARYVEKKTDCDLILSDDGLQHYALARDIEILVIDGVRRFGNNQLLPAGPLREPIKRLASVDFVVTNGDPLPGELCMQLQPIAFISLADASVTKPLSAFQGQTVHAVAGIGNPERFFATLRLLGCNVHQHAFADHYHFSEQDITFEGDVIMTEKDAVKCKTFAKKIHWYLRVQAHIDDSLLQSILILINR